jgi:hypothetical protein
MREPPPRLEIEAWCNPLPVITRPEPIRFPPRVKMPARRQGRAMHRAIRRHRTELRNRVWNKSLGL